MPSKKSRYRTHNGKIFIDLNLKHINQLFDLRDPSPFLERDLDDDAVDYIVSSTLEHPLSTPISLTIHLSDDSSIALDNRTVIESIHNHFSYIADLTQRKLRQIFRRAQYSLVAGLLILFICLTLSQSISATDEQSLFRVIKEGLVIFGWVAMWRPIDLILYSWWPALEKKRVYEKLATVPVEIKFTKKTTN